MHRPHPRSACATARRRGASGTSCRPRSGSRPPVGRVAQLVGHHRRRDVSALVTANVPPNPQQASACGRSRSSIPAPRDSSRSGPVADPQQPQPVAGRVVGDRVREEGAATSSTPRSSSRKVEEVAGPVGKRPRLARQARSPDASATRRVVVDDLGGARRRRADDDLGVGERVDRPPHQPPGIGSVPRVLVHLPAVQASSAVRRRSRRRAPGRPPTPARRPGTGCRRGQVISNDARTGSSVRIEMRERFVFLLFVLDRYPDPGR